MYEYFEYESNEIEYNWIVFKIMIQLLFLALKFEQTEHKIPIVSKIYE